VFNPTYLVKSRCGVFYLRWPIPRRLHPEQKLSTIKLSLHTRDPKRALRLSRSLVQMGESINERGHMLSMEYSEIRALLQKHFSNLIEARRHELDTSGPWTPDKRKRVEGTLADTVASIEAGVPLANWIGLDDSEALQVILDGGGAHIEAGTEAYKLLETDYRHAYRDALTSLLAYDRKLTQYEFDTDHRSQDMPVSGLTADDGLTIAELAATYTAEKKRANSWVAKTILEKEDHLSLLDEVLGGAILLSSLSPLSARKIKDVLSRYPRNRSKNPATRGKPLDYVINLVGVELIQVPTINKYLQTYNDMFEWAYKNGLIEKNYFSGLTIRVRKDRKQGREAFSTDQMTTILRVVTDETSPLIKKAYRKWGPLIGAYTGARLNEIAQLELTDFVDRDGVWCFDINDEGDGKQLKTTAAKRLVPIHPQLIKIGLLDYVETMKAKRQTRLFPDFSYSPNNGWGRTLGRFFNETLLPALNIKSEKLVFHSLRHTVVTQLSRSGVEQTFVKAIVGHQQAGVTQQVYFKAGYTVRQLSDELAKLQYEY
jgi:integrase